MTSSNGNGDRPDFEELYRKLEKAIAAVCPPWLADKKDDLVQDAMMRIMDICEKNPEGNPEFSSSYLWKVAQSTVIDEIRRHRRNQEIQLDDDNRPEMPATRSSSPEDNARSRELGERIRGCLRKMVPNRREAVTLKLQGHSVPESAKILGWTTKKTENLVYRGLKDLKDCLEDYLDSKGLKPC